MLMGRDKSFHVKREDQVILSFFPSLFFLWGSPSSSGGGRLGWSLSLGLCLALIGPELAHWFVVSVVDPFVVGGEGSHG